MRVLITGATGFVGRAIVEELGKINLEIIRIGKSAEEKNDFAINSFNEYYSADISEYENLRQIENIERIDAVVHAAGLAHQFGNTAAAEFESVNVQGTKNILKLAVKLKAEHFILISSTAVYGIVQSAGNDYSNISEIEINENTVCRPETVYAESKLKAEKAALEECGKHEIALTILRLAPVIGENNVGNNVGNTARLIKAIDEKKFLWVGTGDNFKALIYKKDVARACAMILINKKKETEIFNLAAEPIKMKDFVKIISDELGKPVPRIKIPSKFLHFIFRLNKRFLGVGKIERSAATIEKWLSNDVYSAKKIRRAYGFEPETTMAAALGKQIESYRQSKGVR